MTGTVVLHPAEAARRQAQAAHPARTPVNVTPLRSRKRAEKPERDRALDLRCTVGAVIHHPDSDPWGPACTARLVARDEADKVHEWEVIACPDDPAAVGTIASFPVLTGARIDWAASRTPGGAA